MNQTSTKSPIAAAMLEIISERLAKLSTLKRLPGEKPNTVVSTLEHNQVSGKRSETKGGDLRGDGEKLGRRVSTGVSKRKRKITLTDAPV
jgi:hypothetical protein